MRSFFKKSSATPRRTRKKGLAYGTLEERRVLATTAAFVPATGILTVTLSQDGDNAAIDVENGNVVVNEGNPAGGTGTGLTVAANSVNQITIAGLQGALNQSATFSGNFAGRNLNNVVISNVNQVSVLGNYEVAQALNVTLDGVNGGIGDGPAVGSGRLAVGGATTINAGQNTIFLDNALNDFASFNGTTTGSINNDIVLGDVNDINFSGIQSAGDLVVVAGGNISDSGDIVTGRDGIFTGDNINLGGDNQTTNFFRSGFTASGVVNLQEDSNVILLSTTAQSLRIDTGGAILDGFTTDTNVTGLAVLNGNNRIRVGDNGTDAFRAGSITFNSNGHVSITERSDINQPASSTTTIVGTNTARSWDQKTFGTLTNGVNADIDVVLQTGITAENVNLGTQTGDEFDTGALYFFAVDRFELEADSDLIIIERKNEAGTLVLSSTGTITDDDIAQTNIRGLARFTAESVDIGDTRDDVFNAGSIQFDTDETFRLNENSSTNIANASTALASTAGAIQSVINSTGNITNSVGATVDVTGAIGFFGDNIQLGDQTGDDFDFGVLTFNTAPDATGLVEIFEDGSTLIGGNNTATTARITSTGAIQDGQTASTTIAGNARFTTTGGGNIIIGDRGDIFVNGADSGNDFDAVFNAGTVTINTAGNGFVEEDSVLLLSGVNRANNLTLVAQTDDVAANIGDTAFADIAVVNTLDVTGAGINIGTGENAALEDTDLLSIGGLTFNSTINTLVEAETGFELRGSNSSGNLLILRAPAGEITADIDAAFDINNGITIEDINGTRSQI